MEVLARAQELEANGRDIIHLEVGEPDFQAPSEALETVINSLSKKPARYTHTQGILSLREEIDKKIQGRLWSGNQSRPDSGFKRILIGSLHCHPVF